MPQALYAHMNNKTIKINKFFKKRISNRYILNLFCLTPVDKISNFLKLPSCFLPHFLCLLLLTYETLPILSVLSFHSQGSCNLVFIPQ
jgi:hypothetical protein